MEFCSLEFFSLLLSFSLLLFTVVWRKERLTGRYCSSSQHFHGKFCSAGYYCLLFTFTPPCITYLFSMSLIEGSHAFGFCYAFDLLASLISNGASICSFFLFQVGDFYEALGIDACVLVEYAGLNPFGGLRTDSIPRAGCPVVVWNATSVFPNIKFVFWLMS